MKKPSSTKPLPERVFFTDRDLGRGFPETLAQADLQVQAHDDHFGPLTPDTEWLEFVGERGWVALSHNKEIRYNREERDMVMRAGVPLLLLIGKRPHHQLSENFVRTLPKIVEFLDQHRPPFIARVHMPTPTDFEAGRPGRISLWLTHEEWLRRPR